MFSEPEHFLSSSYTSLPSLDSLSRELLGRDYLTKLSLAPPSCEYLAGAELICNALKDAIEDLKNGQLQLGGHVTKGHGVFLTTESA